LIPIRGIEDAGAWLKRSAGWQPDPLNPNRFPAYPRPLSVLELPGAPAQPWIVEKPGVPKGRVEAHKIKSAILSNERTVWAYTPPGYEKTAAPCGLLILFDGGAYTGWIPTPVILDNLFFEKRIPLLVAAFIGHPGLPARNSELTCSPPFTRFLTEELLPWLRRSYRLTEDPGLTIIGGSSNGALGAAFAAFRHPEIFGNVLSQSGAFMSSPAEEAEPEWLIRQFAASPRLPIRFHLDCGLMEAHPAAGAGPNIVTANRHMRDVLRAKGYWVHYQEFNGGHEYLNWRGTLADGLIALLGNR
jgi:enterochelin esterase family protein